MAWVIIGGLSSSMILTVFVMSCVYQIVAKLQMELSKANRFDIVYWYFYYSEDCQIK